MKLSSDVQYDLDVTSLLFIVSSY